MTNSSNLKSGEILAEFQKYLSEKKLVPEKNVGQRLPTVLSVAEVKKLLTKMSGKTRLIAELIYGSGLRLMELDALHRRE